jgi:hypothetical protein
VKQLFIFDAESGGGEDRPEDTLILEEEDECAEEGDPQISLHALARYTGP